MKNYLFIKYYYTSNELDQMFEEMQVSVEDKLEEMFLDKEALVYLHFIDVSEAAYYADFIEVEHTFPLSKEDKQSIFDFVKELVYFFDSQDDKEDTKEFIDLYEKKHYLTHAKYRLITFEDLISSEEL